MNIVYNKKDQVFGVTGLNTNNNPTHYTDFRNSNSFMMSSGNHLSALERFDREMSMTNYENALGMSKLNQSLIEQMNNHDPHLFQKTSKTPNIYYKPLRPERITIGDTPEIRSRADLPLLSLERTLASKRRWDDQGTIRIHKSKTPRFAADSYLGEKPFLLEQPTARPVEDPNRAYHREPAYIFPGIKKPLDERYVEDKKALFQSIIRGKEKPSSFRELIEIKRQRSEPPKKPKPKDMTNDWVKYLKKSTK